MKYDPCLLLTPLSLVTDCKRLIVALSGGLDSMVLLVSLQKLCSEGKLEQELRAIHVNHGLNSGAGDWEAFCRASCSCLDIPLEIVHLNMSSIAIGNLEERARKARYAEFESRLNPVDCLLMGHHRDDQMETLLLRIMRGSGPRGLASIPVSRLLGDSMILRPLLGIDRRALRRYAMQEEVNWIEDDSNQNADFDRNYLRHEIMPLLENRWPGYRESWDKTLQLSHEADLLLTELAVLDLAAVATEDLQVLELVPLLTLTESRQRNLLRHWLDCIAFPSLGWNQLLKLTREVIPARSDSSASLTCEGGCLRPYRGRLYALKSDRPFIPELQLWDIKNQSALPLAGNGQLNGVSQSKERSSGAGVDLLRADVGALSVRYRIGGEAFRLAKRPTKSLKSLLQESGVAPWLRERQPLLFIGEKLICVPGIGVCEGFTADDGGNGYSIHWQAPDCYYSAQA